MSLVAKAADSLLSAIAPHATAEAWTCPSGCHRVRCKGCFSGHIYDYCANNVLGRPNCTGCRYTVYTC
jgi:hypothetical protein